MSSRYDFDFNLERLLQVTRGDFILPNLAVHYSLVLQCYSNKETFVCSRLSTASLDIKLEAHTSQSATASGVLVSSISRWSVEEMRLWYASYESINLKNSPRYRTDERRGDSCSSSKLSSKALEYKWHVKSGFCHSFTCFPLNECVLFRVRKWYYWKRSFCYARLSNTRIDYVLK